jgi:MOSC domain-containing protein YiiM
MEPIPDRHPARVVAVNISPGGIPKLPVDDIFVIDDGLVGDGRAHAKHLKPTRAVSLLDEEIVDALREEGYAVGPGAMGENLTVRALDLQRLAVGARLRVDGGVEIELTEPRKPCFVLDSIDPALQTAVLGRFGFMAKVITGGWLRCGASVEVRHPMHEADAVPA